MSRRAFVAAIVVVSLVGGAVPAAAEAPRPAVMAAPVPGAAALVDTLPPGARDIVAALRILKGLSARNRVYREARGVQGDLRAYYDAQIETARQQLLNREQLGLEPSQVRAYQRVKARLEAERDAALVITEDEKRAAKYGFESTLVRELTGALLRVPRIRQGLERAKEAIDDVRGAFERAKAAIEGGNPITDLVGELQGRLDDLDRFAELGGLINGNLGRQLGNISAAARRELDRVEAAVDEAAGAAESAIGELDAVTAGIDEGLESGRSVRADAALEQAAADLVDRVFAPGGSSAPPEIDVIADALARDALTPAQENVGVAVGVIDPGEFRRMRDRVHAAMLGRSLERIGEICGRLVGAARRAQLDAAAAGQSAPDTSSPCTLFGDPQALQDFIDAERAATTTTTTTVADDSATPPRSPSGGRTVDGTYVGTFDVSALFGDIESEPGVTLEVNEFKVVVADAMVQSLAGQFGLGFVCDEGPNAGAPLAYYILIDGPTGTGLVDASNDWDVSMPMTLTTDARGDCPPPPDDDGGFTLEADDFDASVGGQIDLDFSTDVVTFEIYTDEDDGALIGTLTREE